MALIRPKKPLVIPAKAGTQGWSRRPWWRLSKLRFEQFHWDYYWMPLRAEAISLLERKIEPYVRPIKSGAPAFAGMTRK